MRTITVKYQSERSEMTERQVQFYERLLQKWHEGECDYLLHLIGRNHRPDEAEGAYAQYTIATIAEWEQARQVANILIDWVRANVPWNVVLNTRPTQLNDVWLYFRNRHEEEVYLTFKHKFERDRIDYRHYFRE